ncbi:uncharacterized protein TrAFT101_011255 [Trichoderma asperellum]|uniref:uncharacterized protein n=1 Tax=Trichoderma asperellum TaxID=101201 RepID=UPI003323F07C|nr:hypothetical protein TrAFT101_011255 [Trichoderma asperellum]
MDELTVDLYEVADSGLGGAFRGKGDRDFYPKVLMDSGEKKQVKAKLVRVIPGTFNQYGDPAALLVFEFHFHRSCSRKIDPFSVDLASIPLAKTEKIDMANLREVDLSSQCVVKLATLLNTA